MTVVLGEMDFARSKTPRRGREVTHRASSNWDASLHPAAAAANLRSGGGGRLEVRLFPGGRHPPGPDYVENRGMGDNMWRGLKEGSVFHTT